MNRKLNLVRSPIDQRDYTLNINVRTNEQVVDNSRYCTAVKDQGQIGSCTAHAAVSLMEYNRKKYYTLNRNTSTDGKINEQDVFSEKFNYYTTRADILKWDPYEDSGAYIKDAVASLLQYGACLESSCVYDENFGVKPSNAAYEEAKNYQVSAYAKIFEGNTPLERAKSLNECKQMIASGYGLVAGFACFNNIWTAQNGNIPNPSGLIIGGHAIFICGYDDVNQRFKFKNSWGTNWGANGFGTIPYTYLMQGYMWDIWTVLQQEENNNIIGVRIPLAQDEVKSLKASILDTKNRVNNLTTQIRTGNQATRRQVSSLTQNLQSLIRTPGLPVNIRNAINGILGGSQNIINGIDQTDTYVRSVDTEMLRVSR